jgi:serine/threonine-protein kinase HipA
MSISPARKCQNEGGPGIRDIVELLRTYSTNPREDVSAFFDSIAFNWLIAGTDAHGKNYALLIGSEGRVRLAPLYDVASLLPYSDIDIEGTKLSMKLGGEYRLRKIGLHQWRNLAEELRLDPDALTHRVDGFARQLGDHVSQVRHRMINEGLTHPIIAHLADALTHGPLPAGKSCIRHSPCSRYRLRSHEGLLRRDTRHRAKHPLQELRKPVARLGDGDVGFVMMRATVRCFGVRRLAAAFS